MDNWVFTIMTVIHTYCRYGRVIYFPSSLIQSSEKPFPLKYPELWRRGAQENTGIKI